MHANHLGIVHHFWRGLNDYWSKYENLKDTYGTRNQEWVEEHSNICSTYFSDFYSSLWCSWQLRCRHRQLYTCRELSFCCPALTHTQMCLGQHRASERSWLGNEDFLRLFKRYLGTVCVTKSDSVVLAGCSGFLLFTCCCTAGCSSFVSISTLSTFPHCCCLLVVAGCVVGVGCRWFLFLTMS